MKFVIGERIKEKVEERGVTLKAFAAAIGMTTRNLDRFFERSDVSINQLVKASEFLNYDFVSLYLKNTSKEESSGWMLRDSSDVYGRENDVVEQGKVTMTLQIVGGLEQVSSEFPKLIRVIKSEVESRGLNLG